MSAGRCEICNKLLYLDSRYGDDANFAENAHIHAVGKTGPRHVDDMTQDEINNIDGLLPIVALAFCTSLSADLYCEEIGIMSILHPRLRKRLK